MICTKRAHHSAKFKTFNCSRKVSLNVYFDRLVLLKVYKILAKKVQGSYVSWPWLLMQNLKKNWSVVSKMTRIWWILTRALESLKNLYYHWFLSCKVFKGAVTDMRYLARSKFSRSLVHKKNFSLIWQVVFELGFLFCQER